MIRIAAAAVLLFAVFRACPSSAEGSAAPSVYFCRAPDGGGIYLTANDAPRGAVMLLACYDGGTNRLKTVVFRFAALYDARTPAIAAFEESDVFRGFLWESYASLRPVSTAVAAAAGEISAPSAALTVKRTLGNAGGIIEVTLTLKNTDAQGVTAPIHFNPEAVKIADANGVPAPSGVKTAAEVASGAAGLILRHALTAEGWGGTVFVNPYYPALDNGLGLYRLLLFRDSARFIENEAVLTLRFKIIGAGSPDIRFADSTDGAGRYDPQSPMGLTILDGAGNILTVNA
jgi:hypothetical protein